MDDDDAIACRGNCRRILAIYRNYLGQDLSMADLFAMGYEAVVADMCGYVSAGFVICAFDYLNGFYRED